MSGLGAWRVMVFCDETTRPGWAFRWRMNCSICPPGYPFRFPYSHSHTVVMAAAQRHADEHRMGVAVTDR